MSATKNERSQSARRQPRRRRDETANEALERALKHASVALSEGVASARAVLDAASILISGLPADSQPNLAEIAKTLDQIAAGLSGESPSLRATAINTLLSAVDSEISRWEVRSRSDEDARAVLRIFMGLREVLWELGFRREAPHAKNQSASNRRDATRDAGPQDSWASADLRSAMPNLAGARSAGTQSDRKGASSPGATPGGRVQRIKIEG